MQSSRSGPREAPERNAANATGQGALSVLWTGFGPFLEHTENPSGVVARAACERRGGTDHVEILDVTWDVAERASAAWLQTPGRRIAVHVGLAGDRSWISLESTAWNARESTPDVAGVSRPGPLIDAGPARITTSLRLDTLRDLLGTLAPFDVRISDDPGRYICNATYYHALSNARLAGADALFVHVPPMNDAEASATGRALADAISSAFA